MALSAGLLVTVEMGEGRTPRPRPARGSLLRAWSAILISRTEARTDTLLVLARSVYLSPPTDQSAGRSSAYIALPGPRSGDREDVSLTRQRERKKCWQLSACRSD